MDSGESFGAALRRIRQGRGLSLDMLATRVTYDKSYVSKVENGKKRGSREFAAAVDRALTANGQLLAAWQATEENRTQRVQTAVPFDGMHRRTTLVGIAAVVTATVTSDLGGILQPGIRLNACDVRALERGLARLWAMDHTFGAGDLWHLARSRATHIDTLLDTATYSEEVGRELLRLGGQSFMCAGWLATDAGKIDVARQCYQSALSLAAQAGDQETTSHALTNLAIHALRQRRPQSALRYIDAAERTLPPDAPRRQRAVFGIRRARALAQLGDAAGADQALTVARRIVESDPSTPPERLAFCTTPEIDAIAACCAVELGQPHRALNLLEQALQSYDPRFARNVALYRVRLADARMRHDADAEGAAEAVADALDMLEGSVASARVFTELAEVVRRMQPYRHVDTVDEVLGRYETLITT